MPRGRPRTDTPAPPARRWHALAAASVALLAFVLYLPCLDGPFVFDDPNAVAQSSLIRSLTPLARFVRLSTRPLTDLSFALDYARGGLDPRPYHVTNLLLHALNTALVYAFAWWTGAAADARRFPPIGRLAVACGAAALFAAHPLASESVAYVSSRSEVLVAFFFLLTLIAYAVAVFAVRPAVRSAAATTIPFVTAAALGSKESAITIPAVLLLYDWCFPGGGHWDRTRTRWRLIALSLLPLAAGGAFLLFRAFTTGTGLGSYGETAGLGFDRFGRGEYLMTQFGVILRYLRLTVVPTGLTFDYDWPIARSFWRLDVILPLAALAFLVTLAIRRVRTRPELAFAVLGTLVLLAPTSSFVPIADPAVERRMYLPLAGLSLLACMSLWRLAGRVRHDARGASSSRLGPYATILAPLLVVFAFLTTERAALWADPVALHLDGAAKAPGNPRVRLNLGVVYLNQGKLQEAREQLVEAERLYERGDSVHSFRRVGAFIHYNLGAVLYLEGDPEGAEREIHQAMKMGGEYLALRSMGAYLLGRIAEEAGNWPVAAARYREAVRHNRQSADWQVDLARAEWQSGQAAEAEKTLRTALRLAPGHEKASALLAEVQAAGREKTGGP